MFTDPTGHFGKHNDDKSDYWNKRNQGKVRQLEAKWEKEKASAALEGLIANLRFASKEATLLPPLFGGGAITAPGTGFPTGPMDPPTPWWEAFWNDATALNDASHALDVASLILNTIGESMAVAGAIVIPGVGYEGGNLAALASTNLASNPGSTASTAFTWRADYLEGESSCMLGPIPLPLGRDTANSAFTTIVQWVVPDTTVDLAASGVQVFMNDNPASRGFPIP